MSVLCVIDVQPGFEEALLIRDAVYELSHTQFDHVIFAQFKGCGETLLNIKHQTVWHTKKDRIQSIRSVITDYHEITICGLYTDLFVKDIVRGLSRQLPVRVAQCACIGSNQKAHEDAIEQMKKYKNVTVF